MKNKKHRVLRNTLLTGAVLASGLFAAYYGYSLQYTTKFIEGTYINGINAGNMTNTEVEEVIRDRVEDYKIELTFRDGSTETLTAEDVGFKYTSDDSVTALLENQNRLGWISGKIGNTAEYTVAESYQFDEEKLTNAVAALPELDDTKAEQPVDAHMQFNSDYMLEVAPESEGNALNAGPVTEAVIKAVSEGSTSLDLSLVEGAYKEPTILSDNAELKAKIDDLNGYLGVTVTYDIYDGSKADVNAKLISTWLKEDPSAPGNYYMDEDYLREVCATWMKQLAAAYDVNYEQTVFHSTLQGDISLSTADAGYIIDQVGEARVLVEQILTKTSVEREPYYLLNTPQESLGNTYVEVDIENQRVYLYIDGEQIVATDCVTGKMSDGRQTPYGIYSIYSKDTNRTLKGAPDASGKPSYESFVNYWMPFYEGYGLHDAPWRSSFGGDIYQYSGSHGCVNLPYGAAEKIFNNVSVGTLVVII